jgi:adenylate kinase family enzyme
MMKILIIGQPGSGKQKVSEFIEQNFGISHISTGDICRSNDSIKDIVASGELVPDDIVSNAVHEVLSSLDSWNLDGYPRKTTQMDIVPDFIIQLICPEEVSFNRILISSDRNGREDDNTEVIKKRFRVYRDETMPVIEKYKEQGVPHYCVFSGGTFDETNDIIDMILKVKGME